MNRINDATGIRIYGPQRWAAMKMTNNAQLGAWYDPFVSIFKFGLKTYTQAESASAAAAAAAARDQQFNNILKWGGIAAVTLVALTILKSGK